MHSEGDHGLSLRQWRVGLILFFGLMILGSRALATTYYVNANNPNPLSPYSDWATAATNIQNAVDLAVNGDEVLVTNGIYQYSGYYFEGATNCVTVTNAIVLQSVNGPAYTAILGYQDPVTTNGNDAIRCVYLGNDAVLSGFTLAGGATPSGHVGGGVECIDGSCLVTNCLITGNAAGEGGGAFEGELVNCILSNNVAFPLGPTPGGGGAYSCSLIDCLVVDNQSGGKAGGAYAGTLINCTVVSNTAAYSSGGGTENCSALNSIIYYNLPDNYSAAQGNYFTNDCLTPNPVGGITGVTSANIITSAPRLAGNCSLILGSSGINMGNPAYLATSTDLAGNPRIVNGMVDMGAFENQYTNPAVFVSWKSATPVAPYASWSTAATSLQTAVAAAQPGDIIAVDAGVYSNGSVSVTGVTVNNIVALTNGVTLLGVYGSQSTTIDGNSQLRCAYVGTNSVLNGFTIANGNVDGGGGGIFSLSNAVVINCLVISNLSALGGGIYGLSGNGFWGGTISNCTIAFNEGVNECGGAMGVRLIDCILSNNSCTDGSGGGAATCLASNCLFIGNNTPQFGFGGGDLNAFNYNCLFVNNTASGGGGSYNCTNYNCILSNNLTTTEDGGGGAFQCDLYNCLLIDNTATNGDGGGAIRSVLYNCTVVSNYASNTGGGVQGGKIYNSIVYFNTASVGDANSYSAISYSCTTPAPAGVGNITNAPIFVDPAVGDYELASNSPCINSGYNPYATNSMDLAGDPRISGGTVDMGAYEYQNPSSILSYAWAQQYGLPTDGSVDNADLDGTGFTVDQDWIAGLDPTNSASVLAMMPLAPANNTSGITITWQSVSNIAYFIQSSTNLGAQPAFSTIQTNLVGQTGTMSYTDNTATNSGPYFYRIGVP